MNGHVVVAHITWVFSLSLSLNSNALELPEVFYGESDKARIRKSSEIKYLGLLRSGGKMMTNQPQSRP